LSNTAGRTSANVVADLTGREKPAEIVLIACHLDSWDVGSGAIDDGAGCAIVMETLRLLKANDLIPRRTIRGVLYTNEENGLAGGKAYLKAHLDEMPNHVAAIESDAGAGTPVGYGVSAGEGGVAIIREIAAPLAVIGADDVVDRGGGADIGPLRAYGVPQLSLRQNTHYYFDYHHTEADTFDKVDRHALDRNVAAMALLAWSLAERKEPLPRLPVNQE
jgi:Zn-dependent M28 family amino/carboxypeptidase